MRVTVVPIVIGSLGTIRKGLVKTKKKLEKIEDLEIRGHMGIIQTKALLKPAKILRRVLGTCCHSVSSERPSADARMKNSQSVEIIMINAA